VELLDRVGLSGKSAQAHEQVFRNGKPLLPQLLKRLQAYTSIGRTDLLSNRTQY
jgi:hypothetical protein